MTAAPDHQMIVDGDFQRLGRRRDFPRHFDIGLGRRGIAAGMIVHQDESRGAMLQRPLDDFAGLNGRMIHRAFGLARTSSVIRTFLRSRYSIRNSSAGARAIVAMQ